MYLMGSPYYNFRIKSVCENCGQHAYCYDERDTGYGIICPRCIGDEDE